MKSNNSKGHIYGIDVIRFLSAIFVSIFHFTWRNSEVSGYMPFGWIGVQIFFVISGVVIASSAAGATPSRFIVGRALRLYPAAWIAAAVNLSVLLLLSRSAYTELGINVIPQLGALARSITLVGDYALASAYWTLPIEISFYALIFCMLLLCGEAPLKTVARSLTLLSLPYLLALFLNDIHVVNWPWLDLGYGVKNMLLVRHGPFFALGIFIWIGTRGQALKKSDSIAVGAATMLAIIEIYCRAHELAEIYPRAHGGKISASFLTISASAMFLVFLLSIYLSVRHNQLFRPSDRVKTNLRALGLITYPYYLIHEAVGGYILYRLLSAHISFSMSLAITVVTVGAIAFTIANWGEPFVRRCLKFAFGLWPAWQSRSKAAPPSA